MTAEGVDFGSVDPQRGGEGGLGPDGGGAGGAPGLDPGDGRARGARFLTEGSFFNGRGFLMGEIEST